jgi:hypothetical protein
VGVRILKATFRSAFVLFVSVILLVSGDSIYLSPVEELAKGHMYSLVQWELENFPDKWLYRMRLFLPGNDMDARAKRDLVLDYFHTRGQELALEGRIERAAFSSHIVDDDSLDALNEEMSAIKAAQSKILERVEDVMEGEIAAIIEEEGLTMGGPLRALGIDFPPVDFHFDSPPRVLVVSPRDRIETVQTILLRPDISLEERDALEKRVLEEESMSALVEGIGGVATYPAIISIGPSVRDALVLATHEWLHHYLFFRPLGQAYNRDPDMTSLNETLASIFGQELGDTVFQRFYQAPVARLLSPQEVQPQGGTDDFDFREEMHQTRLQVDLLLDEGKVEEAEQYMELRRQFLSEHGSFIRKLNQAYFAFHGTYGDSPSSVSHVYEQLISLRATSPSLGAFVRQVSSVSTYADFLKMLDADTEGDGR